MKKIILLFSILVLSLTACNMDVNATPTEEPVSAEAIFTAAAMTAFAQIPTETATPVETLTPTPTATATVTLTPFDTVTPQNTLTKAPSSYTAFGCYDAAFAADVTFPDGTVVQPGETFIKTWEIKNTGGCAWESDFAFIFSSGDQMEGANITLGTAVQPGANGKISVTLNAPTTPGPYTGFWRITNAEGTIFGESVYVMIIVDGEVPTATPTP